eukprot:3833064-Pleurochrysis_carterae.AAC.7
MPSSILEIVSKSTPQHYGIGEGCNVLQNMITAHHRAPCLQPRASRAASTAVALVRCSTLGALYPNTGSED